MTRDDLLDKLAMELAEWPNASRPNLHGLYSSFGIQSIRWVKGEGLLEVDSGRISIDKDDWLKRRAELINRPSWDDAPKWAQWLIQTKKGDWVWLEEEPWLGGDRENWLCDGFPSTRFASRGSIPAGHNWRETLEKRPTECEPTAEEDEAFNAMSAMAEQPHVTDARRLDASLAEDMGKYCVGATLDERGKRYGDFSEGAAIMQSLKSEAHGTPGWQRLNYAQREAVDMILHKIGRILNGDPDYADNWHDIAGYAQLVERTLTK